VPFFGLGNTNRFGVLCKNLFKTLALLLGESKHDDLNGKEHKSKDVKPVLQAEAM